MHGIEGILVLIGLCLLAVPVLLVVALVKIGGAKQRISALEHEIEVVREEARRAAQEATQAYALSRAAHAAATAVPPEAAARSRADSPSVVEAAPAPGPVEPVSASQATSAAEPPAEAPLAPPSSPTIEAAPVAAASEADNEATAASTDGPPPPLPWERAVSIGATAAAEQDRRDAGLPPQAPPPQAPRASAPRPPPPDPLAPIVRAVKRWFTEGNVPVKIGVMVLLAGVAALLKYASDQGWVRVPIEVRLAAIAAAAIGGLVFAWRQREERRSFALSLQGGAIGVLMLVAFAAFKLYHLMPAAPAFGITVVLVAGLGVLAVLQRALALATFGTLAGFLAPIWLSTGSGNHVALFSYYAVLNLGIFAIAWAQSRRQGAWRQLNLLGFVFTFGIGTVWGVLDYDPKKFASTEPFLLLFFGLYLLIPIFYARSRGEDRYDRVDGTLVFGAPLVAFALQAGLLQESLTRGDRMPLAFSALILAAIYAALGGVLHRLSRMRPLVESYAVLAVGFATLAVPLALSAGASASVFALEGAALVWLGLRQQRKLPQISGLLLQVAAAVAYYVGFHRYGTELVENASGQWVWAALPTPLANPAFMGAVLIALAGIVIAYSYRQKADRSNVAVLTLWALVWWLFAGFNEIDTHVPYAYRWPAVLAFAIFSGWLAAEGRRRVRDLPMLGVAAAAALAFAIPVAFWQSARHGHPFADGGWAAWMVYAALGWRALACLRDAHAGVRGVAHNGWWWAWATAIACFLLEHARLAELGDAWRMAAIGVPLIALTALLWRRPRALAAPLSAGFDAYRTPSTLVAGLATAAFWGLSLFFPGESDPLPWMTVLNPLELVQIAGLLLLASYAWRPRDRAAPQLTRFDVPAFAIVSFVWISFATLRAVHHWAGSPWSMSMLDDTQVQTALTVVWSVLGVLGWIFGSRRGDRVLWGAGAALMGVVLLKLLVVDRDHLGNIFGIISFLAYGLLCTAVGYFAPAPPKADASKPEPPKPEPPTSETAA